MLNGGFDSVSELKRNMRLLVLLKQKAGPINIESAIVYELKIFSGYWAEIANKKDENFLSAILS